MHLFLNAQHEPFTSLPVNHAEISFQTGGQANRKEDGSRSGTPSSQVSRGSSIDSGGSPLPDLDPERVPSTVGVDEQHPVPCRFCEKAFAKKSFLQIHEQVLPITFHIFFLH